MNDKMPIGVKFFFGMLIIVFALIPSLFLLQTCIDKNADMKCTITVEVNYLNSKTDTLQIPGRHVALTNVGCIVHENRNIACYVTSYKVLKTTCK